MDIFMLTQAGAYEVWRGVYSFRQQGPMLALAIDADALKGVPDFHVTPVWWTHSPDIARLASGDAQFLVRDFDVRADPGPLPPDVKLKARGLPRKAQQKPKRE